ncbi:MAG TPA: C25 family cysteine peptidase, partial [Longimicrobiales bacterium]|nr:C25 family cysteine peptidase [Longimicrobiales bacterium]
VLGGATKTKVFELAGVDPTSSRTGRVEVLLQGGSDAEGVVDHHVEVYLNGSYVGETEWDGKRPERFAVEVAGSVLREGANELGVRNVGDTGVHSLVFLDRFEVAYPQRSELRGGSFEGEWAEGGIARIALGPLGAVAALEVSEPGDPVWLGGVEAIGDWASLRVEGGRRYVVATAEGVLAPRVSYPVASSLRSGTNRADYVLIAPREFLGAAEPLLERRRGEGLVTKGVSLEEIASVFGHGEASGEAIWSFLTYAYHEWRRPSPRYVVLLGDASHDPRNFIGTSGKAPLPALFVKTSYLVTASDPTLGAVNGEDVVPDLSIGRLPAQTVEQAQVLVEKLIAWEETGQGLGGRAVLVADDPDEAGDFEANVRDIRESYLGGRETRTILLSEQGSSTRGRILEELDGGASLLSYVGHGGAAVWASENVLNSWDVSSLREQSEQPLMLTLNCLNGYFVAPGFDSLGEAYLKARGRGTIGAFSPSGLSLDAAAHELHRALMEELTGGGHERLGDAILAAQQAYARTGLMPELLSIYHLLGDPALRMKP